MRITFDFASHWEPAGGVWRYGVCLASALVKQLGGDVTIPCLDRLPPERLVDLQRTGANIRSGPVTSRIEKFDAMRRANGRFIPWKRIVPLVYRPWVKNTLIRRALGRCDVYHALFHCRLPLNTATVATVHDLIPLLFPQDSGMSEENFRTILNQNLALADQIITPSQSVKRDMITHLTYPAERIHAVYHGIDPSFQAPCADRIQEVLAKHQLVKGQYFFYVGAIERRKNIERMVLAYLEAIPTQANCPLILVGASIHTIPVLEQALAESNGRVRRLGYVPNTDLSALYAGAKALIHVSLAEGFGFTPLEAMACGTPVIAASTTATGEVTGCGGLLVDPTNVEMIGQAMKTVLENEQVGMQLSQAGRLRVQEFTWEKAGRQTLDVYQQAMTTYLDRKR